MPKKSQNAEPQKSKGPDRVLIITNDGTHRENLRKPLIMFGYKVDFTGDFATAIELLTQDRPEVILHDWEAFDKSQNHAFQQRIARMDDFASICRIVIAREITPDLAAMSFDCRVRRLMSYASTSVALVDEIKMALASERGVGELQRKVMEIRNDATNNPGNQQAIDELVEQAFTTYPHDPNVRLEFGNLCVRREDLPKAGDIAQRLLAADARNVRAMNLLARVQMKQGQLDEAISTLQNANALSPMNPDRLVSLGDAFFGKGDLKKARSYYAEATRVDPEDAAGRRGLGLVSLSEGDANAALDLFRGSVSEEESAGFFNNAAVQAVRAGKLEESLALYETALRSLQTDRLKPLVYFNISLAHRRLKQFREALVAVKRCLRYDPQNEKGQRQKRELEAILVAGGEAVDAAETAPPGSVPPRSRKPH